MRMLLSFVLLLMIAGANAFFARQRGRDPVGWFLLGLLLGVFGLLLLVVLPKLKKNQAGELEQDEDRLLLGIADSREALKLKEWFYLDKNSKQQGPVGFALLSSAFEKGDITLETYVWYEGMVAWERIREIPLLLNALPLPLHTP